MENLYIRCLQMIAAMEVNLVKVHVYKINISKFQNVKILWFHSHMSLWYDHEILVIYM